MELKNHNGYAVFIYSLYGNEGQIIDPTKKSMNFQSNLLISTIIKIEDSDVLPSPWKIKTKSLLVKWIGKVNVHLYRFYLPLAFKKVGIMNTNTLKTIAKE